MTQITSTRTALKRAAFALLAGAVIYVTPLEWSKEAISRVFTFPEGFEDLAPVPELELAGMRGGMVMPNGMILNFRVEFKTVVDGELVNHQFFDTNNLEGSNLSPEFFANGGIVNNLVIDSSGELIDYGAASADVAGIMTQVLNDASGLSIEHSTALSASIENAGALADSARTNSIASQVRNSSLLSIR